MDAVLVWEECWEGRGMGSSPSRLSTRSGEESLGRLALLLSLGACLVSAGRQYIWAGLDLIGVALQLLLDSL